MDFWHGLEALQQRLDTLLTGTTAGYFDKNPKRVYIVSRADGSLVALPVVLWDAEFNLPFALESGTARNLKTGLYAGAAGPAQIGNTSNDGNLAGDSVLETQARSLSFNGATWDRTRGGDMKLKTVTVTAAGDAAVWTPAAGKKFRLLGHAMLIGNPAAAVAGTEVVKLTDGAAGTEIDRLTTGLPAAAGNTAQNYAAANPRYLWPNGYLSAAANNVLTVNVGTALTAGGVTVTAWGLEE